MVSCMHNLFILFFQYYMPSIYVTTWHTAIGLVMQTVFGFLKILKFQSLNQYQVCLYLNAFATVISKIVMIFHNIDIFDILRNVVPTVFTRLPHGKRSYLIIELQVKPNMLYASEVQSYKTFHFNKIFYELQS